MLNHRVKLTGIEAAVTATAAVMSVRKPVENML